MRRRRRSARREQTAELNITAFMNLMVVLVPFLLITAVFSRITILELNLPTDQASEPPVERGFSLSLQVREDSLRVLDRQRELGRWVVIDGEYPLPALAELLGELKGKHPKVESATLLLEGEVSYDSLVQLMDAVRLNQQGAPLFPQIGIGELGGPS